MGHLGLERRTKPDSANLNLEFAAALTDPVFNILRKVNILSYIFIFKVNIKRVIPLKSIINST